MEQNTVKTSVFLSETVINETVEQAVDADFFLPDTYPDIIKILKCRAVPMITSKSISGKTVSVNGMVQVTVFYIDKKGNANSFDYPFSFEKTKETEIELENIQIVTTAKCDYMNCRAISDRKIDIHGAIGITICGKRKKSNEIIADIENKNIEILRNNLPATTPVEYSEKYLLIEEERELPSGEKGKYIFRYDANACIKESKIVSGKVIVKGDLILNIKYCSDNTVKSIKTTIPFSQILEIETLGESCECSSKVQICYFDIKPKTDSNGEFSKYNINAKILVSSNSYCENDIPIVVDLYSRKKQINALKKEVEFKKAIKKINETFNCKKTISLENETISSVVDTWCEVKVGEKRIENNELKISGTVIASVLFENSEGSATYLERPIEFSYKYPTDNKDKELECEADIVISSSGYTIISGDSIEIKVEFSVNAVIYEISKRNVITEIEESDNEVICNSKDCAMVIYFADKGESLWDISKKYLSNKEEIKKINGITEDYLSENTKILIPIA